MHEQSESSKSRESSRGLLLVGHGTRDRAGQAEALQTARDVQQLAPAVAVEAGFLELCAPTIAQAVERLAQRGVREFTAAPLLLFAAGHVKRDIPRAVAEAAARHENLRANMAGHLGCHREIVELSAQRFREALRELPEVASGAGHRSEDALLLLVGRGGKDPAATREMMQFAKLRGEATPVARTVVAFLAMSQPSLDEVLPQIEAAAAACVVVQPHLLFQGELQLRLKQRIDAIAAQNSRQQWIVTNHLGPSPLLARAIVDIAGCAPRSPDS